MYIYHTIDSGSIRLNPLEGEEVIHMILQVWTLKIVVQELSSSWYSVGHLLDESGKPSHLKAVDCRKEKPSTKNTQSSKS